MLFGVDDDAFAQCSFCERVPASDESKILLFDDNPTPANTSICSDCVAACVAKASEGNEEPVGNDAVTCAFCQESVNDDLHIYVRRSLGICPRCVGRFIETSLSVGKEVGTTSF